uniref:Uncharacterized protein n=1 Tax=Arundo donax TaxID=35708 RepID=A0A0A9FK96_ARUDO
MNCNEVSISWQSGPVILVITFCFVIGNLAQRTCN